jgi:hypothetical protein
MIPNLSFAIVGSRNGYGEKHFTTDITHGIRDANPSQPPGSTCLLIYYHLEVLVYWFIIALLFVFVSVRLICIRINPLACDEDLLTVEREV